MIINQREQAPLEVLKLPSRSLNFSPIISYYQTMPSPHPVPISSQDLLQLPLLLKSQGRREFNIIRDDEFSSFRWLLGKWHAPTWIVVFGTWLCGTGFLDLDLLAVDGGYGSLPACECLFEIEVYGLVDIVAFAGVEGVFFLGYVSR